MNWAPSNEAWPVNCAPSNQASLNRASLNEAWPVALGEAMRRGNIVENVVKVAKPPRIDEDEIVPFNMEEARRILDAAADVRNERGSSSPLRWGCDAARRWGSSGPISKSGGGTVARRAANVEAKPRSSAKNGSSSPLL